MTIRQFCLPVLGVIFVTTSLFGEEPTLGVKYEGQENSQLCQSASLQMLLATVSKKDIPQRKIQSELNKRGGYLTHKARISYLKDVLGDEYEVNMTYEANVERAWKSITMQLDNSLPVVMSTRLTASGHVVVAIGAAVVDGEKKLVVHDPWGCFDFEDRTYRKLSGAAVQYPFDELYVRNRIVELQLPGKMLLTQHYITGECRWLEKVEGAVTVKKDVKDWEFVSIRRKGM